jgi:F-type H+-transporting ATPase subunit b
MWLLAILLVGVASTGHAAADGDWRPTYDLVMRWINFLILAAVIVKFGRRPIADMLNGRRTQISDQIEKLENERKAALARVAEAEAMLDDSHDRFVTITERLTAQGEKRHQQLVAEARQESQRLMNEARQRIAGEARRAADLLRSELVDVAIDQAHERLRAEVSPSDNQQFANDFIRQLNPNP